MADSSSSKELVTGETLAGMAGQLLDGNWRPADLAAVAAQLNALEKDTAPFHRVELGEFEPAVIYPPVV